MHGTHKSINKDAFQYCFQMLQKRTAFGIAAKGNSFEEDSKNYSES
jgi:hypothetical protein